MQRDYVIGLVRQIVSCDEPTAKMLVDRLTEEGLLHIGYGDADIDRVVGVFTETYGTTKTTRQDRWAAQRLVKKYGAQAVVGIIQLLASLSTERYAPIVGSVAQLEDKWISVLAFLRKHKGSEEIIA